MPRSLADFIMQAVTFPTNSHLESYTQWTKLSLIIIYQNTDMNAKRKRMPLRIIISDVYACLDDLFGYGNFLRVIVRCHLDNFQAAVDIQFTIFYLQGIRVMNQ